MKKFNQSLIGVLLITVILFSSVTGCGAKKDVEQSSSNDEISFHEEGLPIVDDTYAIEVLTTRWGNMGDSFTQNQWLKDLEKNTNIKVNWQVQSLNDWNEQKQIMLASGELPDVSMGSRTFSDTDIINNLELFLPLDDLVEKYMPNYKKALEETPEMKKVVTYPDGKMYSMSKKLPNRPQTCNQPTINKVWLDNLGLEIPTTIDELYEVLKAFKEKDANGNGDPNDEIPITGVKGVEMDLLNPFGITDIYGAGMLIQDDGSLVYYPISEQYKEGIKWLHKLYTEGIIDAEAFTQDDTMATGKKQNPDIARVGFSYQWIPDAVFGKWSDEYIAIAPIEGKDGKQYAGGDPNGVLSISRNEATITPTCEHPEIVARWLDQFYTGEASIQNFWGAIGTVISKNDDGMYTLNDPPEGTSADAWYWDQSLRDFGPKYVGEEFQKKIILSKESGDGLKEELSKLGDPYITTPFPTVMYTEKENEELPTLTTDIDKFIEISRATWITDGGIDEGWNDYIKQLEDMGLKKLIEIRQNAYDRYTNAQ